MPLTPIQQRIQKDLCQNPEKGQTPTRTHQASGAFASYTETQFSMQIKSKIVVSVRSKTETRVQAVESSMNFQTRRIELRVPVSRGRNLEPIEDQLKAIDLGRKAVPKSSTKCKSKHVSQTQSSSKQSGTAVDTEWNSIIDRKQKSNDLNGKRSATVSHPAIEWEQFSDEDSENNKYDGDTNIDLQPDADETSFAETEEISPIKSGPKPEESSITLQEKNESEVGSKQGTAAASDTDSIKITSSQSQWAEDVLNLLNNSTEKDLSKKLATIGPKTAMRIIKCREINGEYQRIDDLRKMLGWSERVYKKFLSKNSL